MHKKKRARDVKNYCVTKEIKNVNKYEVLIGFESLDASTRRFRLVIASSLGLINASLFNLFACLNTSKFYSNSLLLINSRTLN